MKRRGASFGFVSSAALLLPFAAVPESRVQTAATGTATSSAAHVNFKIVVPQVLYLQVGDLQAGDMRLGDVRLAGTGSRNPGAPAAAVMTNGRDVTLNTTRAAADSISRSSVILRASGRKVISQLTQCASTSFPTAAALPQAHDRANAATQRYICTASTP